MCGSGVGIQCVGVYNLSLVCGRCSLWLLLLTRNCLLLPFETVLCTSVRSYDVPRRELICGRLTFCFSAYFTLALNKLVLLKMAKIRHLVLKRSVP